MKLTQRSFNPKFMMIDFIDQDKSRNSFSDGEAKLHREKSVGKTHESSIDNVVEIISSYEFYFGKNKAKFIFFSRFDVVPEASDLKSVAELIDSNYFDEKISAMVHSQESIYIRRILFDFGVNVGSGFPVGEEFSI